jgi:hypothetical protein
MTNQETTGEEIQFTEAPASLNLRFVHPTGFQCQFTLRGNNGIELLGKVEVAMEHLIEIGCIPYPTNNGNGKVTMDPQAWCPTHQCEMKRYEKNGRVWFSHNINGEWCHGAK